MTKTNTRTILAAAICALTASMASTAFAAGPSAAPADVPDGDVFARRTVRTYSAEALTNEQIRALTLAAFSAPTGGGQRALEFVWVTDRARMAAMQKSTPYGMALASAPAALVIVANPKAARYDELQMFDAGAATEAVLVEAARLGLVTVPMSIAPLKDREIGVRAALELPDHLIPEIMIAVGHAAPDAVSSASALYENPAQVHFEKWQGKK
ncbi:nitroreductase family protein [Sutterella sp.]|uniref:nitroreductase family protein n=1 Tax=Sutterella sp. TaxID=1981025 RepID=UPI0026E0260A|nr:nitroreductase family protein [Sutterella sp.]MDO5530787.1 nitroreductase family protein [Sutterella sp.]